MNKIDETRTLDVALSHAQKFVLSRLVLPDQSPNTAYDATSADSNLKSTRDDKNIVANRKYLAKLGLLTLDDNTDSVKITERGIKALQQENLIDDMGSLTPQGEIYAYAIDLEDIANKVEQGTQKQVPTSSPVPDTSKEPPPTFSPPLGIANAEPNAAMASESWTMIADMQENLAHRAFLNQHKL